MENEKLPVLQEVSQMQLGIVAHNRLKEYVGGKKITKSNKAPYWFKGQDMLLDQVTSLKCQPEMEKAS